jgi:hypothetical protein
VNDYKALKVSRSWSVVPSRSDLTSETQASVERTAKIMGGSLDYIIANAALVTTASSFCSIRDLYVPLVLKGRAKKIITLSTGMADLDLVTKYQLDLGVAYTINKAYHLYHILDFSQLCLYSILSAPGVNRSLRSNLICPLDYWPGRPASSSALTTNVYRWERLRFLEHFGLAVAVAVTVKRVGEVAELDEVVLSVNVALV